MKRTEMLSSLRLDKFLLEELSVEANPQFQHGGHESESYSVAQLDFDIAEHKERLAHRVRIDFEMVAEAEAEACGFNRIKIRATGFFSFDDDTERAFIQQITPFNQLSILFGVMRGVVANVTGMSPAGTVMLPSVNFVEMVQAKAAEQKESSEREESEPQEEISEEISVVTKPTRKTRSRSKTSVTPQPK